MQIYLPTQNLLASTMYLDCAAKYMKLPEEIGKIFNYNMARLFT